jgi:hypothetical protein
MALRKVTIVISNKVVGKYEARSYPHDNMKDDNLIELYAVPVYKLFVNGIGDDGAKKSFEYQCVRFMPYWNDPKVGTDPRYSAKGWVNSGLSSARTIIVTEYKRDYELHNRVSFRRGAIVLKSFFYLHTGPEKIDEFGYGSAGCVETVGNFDNFKVFVASLSGSDAFATLKQKYAADSNLPPADIISAADDSIETLVSHRKLIVEIEGAAAPDIKKLFTRTVPTTTIRTPVTQRLNGR